MTEWRRATSREARRQARPHMRRGLAPVLPLTITVAWDVGHGDGRDELGAVLGDPAVLGLLPHHEAGDVLAEHEGYAALAELTNRSFSADSENSTPRLAMMPTVRCGRSRTPASRRSAP